MQVIATAGHVDHGKSTLVRALTGMEPDRWAEERRRGMTIDLGFAWTAVGAETVAFVDVPGHERFVTNMLAGIGAVPAAMIVVSADEGWMPQSAEHLAALNALGVRHGLLVVTRSDLEAPEAATELALAELARTSLKDVEAVAVSAVTGQGMDELRAALARLVGSLPPGQGGPVRLWVDRSFTIKGSGTVVTGTLGAGVLRTGDELELTGAGKPVRVRGLQSLGQPVGEVHAPARVAVNLRGVGKEAVGRGAALLTPGQFLYTDLVDVRVHGDRVAELAGSLTLHLGSAAVAVRVRPLGPDTARLRLSRALPLRIGDRALLRDPGRHHVAGGVTVLDVVPPGLTRRGAAAARAEVLQRLDGTPDAADELRRRRLIKRPELARMGVEATGAAVAGEWLADPGYWAALGDRLCEEVERYAKENPLEPGAPIEALRHRLGLPDRALVEALVQPPLVARGGRVSAGGTGVPDDLVRAVETAFAELGAFAAPEANRLTELGIGARQLAAAERAGLVVQVAPGVVLRRGTPERAVQVLADLPQPFTLSQARQALDTTRRVAVPLLGLLDAMGATRRHGDDRRTVTGSAMP